MQALIELKDICKVYTRGEKSIHALDNISLTVNEGEFVAIVGESGSGKTTMMNIIGCLDTPTSGSYFLAGQETLQINEPRISKIRNRQIGFIFQGFNLVSSLSALENVELPLLYRKTEKAERRALALEALDKVGLLSRQNHRPGQMSGGQQQRVAIARAVASKPDIILADEPTGNLDYKSCEFVMEVLRELSDEGKTLILITHDKNIASQADRIVSVSDGRIVL